MREPIQDKRVKTSARSRLVLLLALLLVGMASAACIQQSNTYPIEIFREMHYAQFHSSQEPPRVLPPAESVAFESSGGPGGVLEVPAIRERPYDPAVAGEIYRVNCSMCHGVNGDGNGPAARHIASPDSFYSSTTGSAYLPPPNLLVKQEGRGCTRPAEGPNPCLTPETAYSITSNGILVMPRFGKLMSEEDIRDVIAYVFDTENGLGTGQ